LIAVLRRQVHPLATVIVVLQLLDLLSTALVIHLGGSESNRVVEALGWPLAITLKFAFMLYVGFLSTHATPFVERCLRAVAILYTVVVIWNLLVAGALA
jgi:hypothetical protein